MTNKLDDLLSNYRGEGPYIYIKDKKYIDAASGTFNLGLGYTHKRLAKRLKQQIDRCVHLSSAYTHEMGQCILEKLKAHTPSHIDSIWLRDITGSGAVECALRIAQKATGRSGVISLFTSHHGQSLATAQISGNAFRLKHFHTHIPGSFKIPVPPGVYADTQKDPNLTAYPDLKQILELGSSGKVACLIIEPILGNGGNIVIPRAFYRQLRKFCDEHGILIIADEVQTGFGRTGTFFATNGYAKALQPDLIVFAKGAGGIGIPVAGVLMRNALNVLEPFEHSSTSGANPLSLVALNETIHIIEDEGILDNVKNNEAYLREKLLRLQDKYATITNLRGIGYMFGFDTPSPEFAAQIIELASENGLIMRGARYGKSSALKIRPPLICNRHNIDEIIEKLDHTFQMVN